MGHQVRLPEMGLLLMASNIEHQRTELLLALLELRHTPRWKFLVWIHGISLDIFKGRLQGVLHAEKNGGQHITTVGASTGGADAPASSTREGAFATTMITAGAVPTTTDGAPIPPIADAATPAGVSGASTATTVAATVGAPRTSPTIAPSGGALSTSMADIATTGAP